MLPLYQKSTLALTAMLITLQPLIAQKKQITIDEIWNQHKFASKRIQGLTSMNDGIHYTSLLDLEDGQAIQKFDYEKGKVQETLLKPGEAKIGDKVLKIVAYELSPDETKILLTTARQKIYRHSRLDENYVFELETRKLTPVAQNQKQMHANFSPDGTKIGYVRNNNLYYKDLSSGKEVQVTTDGVKNQIINGSSDWVYEEEFKLVRAFEWSPDSKHIAFYRFDESQVKNFEFPVYGTLYPEQYKFKYPKAGEKNSEVTLHIYNVESGQKSPVTFDSKMADMEYIPRIKWTKDPNKLSIQFMNREQNLLILGLFDVQTKFIQTLLAESSDTWIDIHDDLTFLEDGKHFIWTSERTGMNQIYLYDLDNSEGRDGGEGKRLSEPNLEVFEFVGADEEMGIVYFMGGDNYNPGMRVLYSYMFREQHVMPAGAMSGYNTVSFSKGFKYFINYSSNINTPQTITVHNKQGFPIRTIEENKDLQSTLKQYDLGKREMFKFNTESGMELFGWMIKPPDFSPTKQYPVLMYCYGGPGSNTTSNKWGGYNDLWYQMLAQKGYIVVSVDGRGTGSRGAKFKKSTYMQLGKYETEDQIAAAKYLATQSYVDGNRIGIWGWSFGGYLSTLCLEKGNDIFKMAIAVAPVTNWRYYDTIYTERYMRTPQENGDGYDMNSPINHVDKIKGKFLLVHGTADDNVHFQNTTELINSLVDANVDFDLAVYPNKNHGIYGGNTRNHLYEKMTNFILENL